MPSSTAGVPCLLGAPEEHGLGKEMAGSPAVVRAETAQQRVCAPEEEQAGPDPGQGGEADGLPVLPAQVRACPVLEADKEQTRRPLLVM